MKHFILTSVSAFALFSASGALAAPGDNVSTINQVGGAAVAQVSQTGGTNDSDVLQSGTGGSATITQVEADQGFPPRYRGAGGVEAPFGTGDLVRSNFSAVQQSGASTLTSFQQGDLNRSRIVQAGDGSSATLDQRGLYNNNETYQSGGSTAIVTQGGGYGDNNSIIAQSGGGRVAVNQSADTTVPTFYPTNDSFAYQESNADIGVTQIGQQNVADTRQFAGSTGATAIVYQQNTATTPATNSARTYQYSDASSLTDQRGAGNTATTDQFSGAGASTSNILQYSDNNLANVTQYSPNNLSNVYQAGTGGNVALVTQN